MTHFKLNNLSLSHTLRYILCFAFLNKIKPFFVGKNKKATIYDNTVEKQAMNKRQLGNVGRKS